MKKKSVSLICSQPKTHSVQRLLSEAKKAKLSMNLIDIKNCLISDNFNCDSDVVIHRSTALNFDDLDLALLRQFELRGAKSFNSSTSLELTRNKERQIIELKNRGHNPPPSLFIRGKIDDPSTLEKLETELDLWQKMKFSKITDQFVLKTVRGNKGIGVSLINGRESLFSVLETFWGMSDQRFILQPFLAHEVEYRLFYQRGKEPIIIAKKSHDGFKANANRAKTTLLNAKSLKQKNELVTIAEKIADDFQLTYAGFDFWQLNDGRVIVGEVNPMPGFENIEELTKRNIARELLELFVN